MKKNITKTACLLAMATLSTAATAQTLNVTRSGDTTIVSIDRPTKYLLLPVEEEKDEAQVMLCTGAATDVWMDVRLAQSGVDYYVPFALGEGKSATVKILGLKSKQVQCIAYSTDNGRTFTNYAGNPVLIPFDGIQDFRDPKVFWYEKNKSWYMIVSADKEIRLYKSKNLKEWAYVSAFGEGYGQQPCQYECPDFFQLPVNGDENNKKWVMIMNINPGCPFGGSATIELSNNRHERVTITLATWAPLGLCEGKTRHLDIYADRSSIEIFIDGGRIAMTNLVFPTAPYENVTLCATDGKADFRNLRLHQLSR